MLPYRFTLTTKAEEKLKREKQRTGIPPNLAARELFFLSIEKGKKFGDIESERNKIKFGKMALEKTVWLGDCQTVTEVILEQLYPHQCSETHSKLWALHVESEL